MKRFLQFLFIWFGSLAVVTLVANSFEDATQANLANDLNYQTEEVQEVLATSEAEENVRGAFIFVPGQESYELATNGAYYVNGNTSSNCSAVVTEAKNSSAGLYDKYELSEYKYGDTSFRYGIRSDWNNLAEGDTVYTFTAYCDGEQEPTSSVTLSYTVSEPTYTSPNYNSESSYGSSYTSTYDEVDYYTNSAGDTVQSPTYYDYQPSGASAICGDGTYSFSKSRSGTCSHHGGVSSWL